MRRRSTSPTTETSPRKAPSPIYKSPSAAHEPTSRRHRRATSLHTRHKVRRRSSSESATTAEVASSSASVPVRTGLVVRGGRRGGGGVGIGVSSGRGTVGRSIVCSRRTSITVGGRTVRICICRSGSTVATTPVHVTPAAAITSPTPTAVGVCHDLVLRWLGMTRRKKSVNISNSTRMLCKTYF